MLDAQKVNPGGVTEDGDGFSLSLVGVLALRCDRRTGVPAHFPRACGEICRVWHAGRGRSRTLTGLGGCPRGGLDGEAGAVDYLGARD